MTDGGEIPIIYPYIAYRLKLLRGRVKFPTGGSARELSFCSADPVQFRSRQYSLDGRRGFRACGRDQGILINVSPAFICHSSVCDPLPETIFGRIIMAAAVKTPWTFG